MDKLAYDLTICETHCQFIVQTLDWSIITRSEPGERHGKSAKSEDCLQSLHLPNDNSHNWVRLKIIPKYAAVLESSVIKAVICYRTVWFAKNLTQQYVTWTICAMMRSPVKVTRSFFFGVIGFLPPRQYSDSADSFSDSLSYSSADSK